MKVMANRLKLSIAFSDFCLDRLNRRRRLRTDRRLAHFWTWRKLNSRYRRGWSGGCLRILGCGLRCWSWSRNLSLRRSRNLSVGSSRARRRWRSGWRNSRPVRRGSVPEPFVFEELPVEFHFLDFLRLIGAEGFAVLGQVSGHRNILAASGPLFKARTIGILRG